MELLRRVGFAAVAIPFVAWVAWLGGLPLAAVLSVVAAIAASEFFRIAAAGGVRAFSRFGIVLAAAIPIVVHFNYIGVTAVPLAAGALAVLAVFAAAVWLRVGDRPLSAVSATVFGVLYVGGLLSFAYSLRHHRFITDAGAGTALLGLPLIVTWATDTGGYAFGRWLGRTKLAPVVSPGKTIAGAVGGLMLAVLATGLYVAFVLRPAAHLVLTPIAIGVFGTIASVTAQVGDLAESLLKREAGVKDSSHLIPGTGGALDRIDSLLFVLPVAFVLLTALLIPVP